MSNIVDDTFRKAVLAANNARKADTEKRLAYYFDDQLSYLHDVLVAKFMDVSKLTPCFVNVVRKIVDLKSRVYADEPKRTLDGTDADKALFAEIAEQSGLSIKLKTASRLTKLCKTCMIRPVWRSGRLDLDILTGDVLDVVTGDSPEDITSVMVTHYGTNGRPEEITYSVWSADAWERLDWRGHQIDGGVNPYGQIPFIALHDHAPTDSFWCPGGDDLIAIQDAINKALVDLLHTVEFQGFGVGWVRGAEGGGTLKAGPGSLVELPKDGELGYAATQAPIEEMVAAIDQLVKWAAVSNGIPAASLSTDPTVESGISKIVGNAELTEARQDDVALWRTYERRIFAVIRQVWNFHNPTRRLSDAATLQTDFADPKPETSAKDQAATWQLLLEMGLISPVDVALERNPDLGTREDAMAYLLTVRDETAALNSSKI